MVDAIEPSQRGVFNASNFDGVFEVEIFKIFVFSFKSCRFLSSAFHRNLQNDKSAVLKLEHLKPQE
jgi:hypothetical protein